MEPTAAARLRVRDAKDAVYRTAILQAAELAFADAGFDAAKVQDVAAAAGVSLATLYKLYPGKADLRREVHELRTAEILDASTANLPADADALGLLMHGALAYARYQLAHPAYLRLTLREGATWTTRKTMTLPEQSQAWDQGYSLAVEVFRAGAAAGVFVDEPPAQQARLMIAILQVILGEWVDDGMITPPDEVLRRIADAMTRSFAARQETR
jgi:AcrR family transcriptional regulator